MIKHKPMPSLDAAIEGEVIIADHPYKLGDLVTRTGADIQRVTKLDNECYFGSFECLHDTSGVYEVGETENNMARRYQKITEQDYPKLKRVALSRQWIKL